MARVRRLPSRIILAMASLTALASPRIGHGSSDDGRVGTGHAYMLLGDLPVMHRGRIQALYGVAVDEARRIHGRSTIGLVGPDGESSSWEPVAALLDWSARPEFWDDREFILVQSPALRRLILGAPVREQVRSLAAGESGEARAALEGLAGRPALTEADLRSAARRLDESGATGKSLGALADRLVDDRRWLSPRAIEHAEFQVEGRTLTLPRWVDEILDGEGGTPKLSGVEKEAIEVGERFAHYKALREHESPELRPLDLLVSPRPGDETYRDYTAEVFRKGMRPDEALSPLEANVAHSFVGYLQGLPSKDWALPGEDGVFDQKFTTWLTSAESPWVPLGLLLKGDDAELARAGLPKGLVLALRESYRDLEAAERAAPGRVPDAPVIAMLEAARKLGTSFNNYPAPGAMRRESHLNRFAPFSRASIAYGVSLVLLLIGFGLAGRPGLVAYGLGILGLAAGAGFELYGFALATWVYRQVPVSNLYETLAWAALATSILGLALELFWRRKYPALAASLMAWLAIGLAEGSPLNPTLHPALPQERYNRWLALHVVPVVSGYAALALAMGLGLLAVGHYLTATYRRTPTYRELAWPMVLGALLYGSGLGLPTGHPSGAGLEAVGIALMLAGGLGLLGELANRSPRRAIALGAVSASAGLLGLIDGPAGSVPAPMARAFAPPNAWFLALVGASSAVMGLLALRSRDALARVEALAGLIHRSMIVGVLLLASGLVMGGAWARSAWAGPWTKDPKVVWSLISLLAYLAALLGRKLGWMQTSGIVSASIFCFMPVFMTWYGLNCVLGAGQHSYGFAEIGDHEAVIARALAIPAAGGAAAWRWSRSRR